jgi:16S rRNA C967 or C1407 C5-methylase (RsmB/RsmF family)
MLPEQFIKRLDKQAYIDSRGLLAALGTESTKSVRINPFKWSQPIAGYEQVPWEPNGYYLHGRPLFTPDPLFHAGVYYPQEASGMWIGEAFRQLTEGMRDIRVLDLCGAPGGKSTNI